MANRRAWLYCLGTFFLAATLRIDVIAAEAPALKETKLGSTRNVHLHGTTLLCGQPSKQDLAAAKQRGIKVVVTLRGNDETDWNEQAAVEELGLKFNRVAFHAPDTLTDDVFEQTRKVLRDAKAAKQPVMLHCGSANRVGAVWMVYRVLDEGLAWDQAEQEAKAVGLRTEGYLTRAKQYVESHKK